MRFTRITSDYHPLFMQAWELYKKSFPARERRNIRTQKKIMGDPSYRFESITEGDMFVGIVLWWEFEDMRYIEHLATLPGLRGKGYGASILEKLVYDPKVPIVLEVEHPTDGTSRRRIDFYRRAGFVLNEHPYTHPPYKKGGEPVPLMLMTWPTAITEARLTRFLEEHHPVIHRFVLPVATARNTTQ